MRRVLVAAAAWALATSAALAQAPAVTFSMPTVGLVYAYAYVADALGFWKDAGLEVKLTNITGLASTNAMLGGSVEFSAASGPTVLTAWARGQRPVILATTNPTLAMELVVSKDLAQASALAAGSPVAERARALRGKTLGVDAPNSIIHGYLKYVLRAGGLDPEKDVTVTPLAPSAAVPALQARRIDGFAFGSPWTTLAERQGDAMWVSATRGDLPELQPFAMAVVMARSGYCEENGRICEMFGQGIMRGLAFLRDEPAKALAIVQARFKDMDPSLVAAAFEEALRTTPRRPATDDAMMAHAQELSVAAGLLKPEEKHASFQGMYNNAFLR